ncbi:Uncharacterised protein [Bacteroides faecis]|uniref:Uncharacterized protein n=1 Tax=Bacteroides faecis TaxID=674529 RepID=A0A174LWK8_9BACE|nr:Uncharacterised protein [Bacteroides faecis]
MIPFVREAFEAVNDFIPVGRDEVGSGIFYAKHGLVGFQTDFRCIGDGLVQNAGVVSGGDFLSVDQQTGKDDAVRLGGKVQFLFPERDHSLDTAEEYFSVMCHEQCVLVDGSQRESVLGTVVVELLLWVVKLGESLIRNQQQVSFLYG